MIEKKLRKIKFKEDDYGLLEMNGKFYKFKSADTEKNTATFEEIEDPEKFKKDFDEVADELIKHIDKRKLMFDVLRHYPRKEVDDIHRRIFTRKQPIRERNLCYSLMVGRKQILIRD